MKTKILITGSAGFIFSNFIRHAFHTKQNYNIISIDKVSKSHVLHNVYVNKNHEFYIGNVADEHLVNVVFESQRPDIVIHAASELPSDDVKNQDLIKSNVIGTQVIIDACIKWGVKKLIYISTSEVYGLEWSEPDLLFTEKCAINPCTLNAASKAAGELLVKAAQKSHGLQYIIARLSDNYGPWQTQEKLIPSIIKNILNQNKVQLSNNGMQNRNITHVFDTCNALFKIINDGKINTEYNVSSSQELPDIEIFQRICNLLGTGYNLVDFTKDESSAVNSIKMDNAKIKELGWKSEFKFNDGLAQTLQWYLNNKWMFKLG